MSIFSKFFLTLFGNALPSWLRLYIARVEGDGGTIVDRNHTKEVYDDVSDQIDYLLIANACDAGKLDVLYSFYAEEHPWYVDYIDRILDDGGTVERYAEVYNTYDDLESAGVGEDAFLWLSASSGKTGLLYRMGANTIVYDHEQRVTADSGTTYLPGANARIVQQLVREDLYNDPSIIIPCASGKEGVLYSLLPTVETNTTLLDYYTGSAAAYSLRSLSTSTTSVVKVRRSSDNSEQDFTASDIADGTLLSFVNQSVEKVLNGDFSDGSTDWTVVNGSITGGQYVSGTLTAYQAGLKQSPFSYTGTGVLTFDLVVNSGSVRVSAETPVNSYSTSGRKSVTLTNPTQLEFNAFNLGFDGTIDNVSFIPTNVDGFVTTWYDQSGNGNNATQATAANQPKIVSTGSLVTENGKAAIDFDGTNDCLLNSTLTASATQSVFYAKKGIIRSGNSAVLGFPVTGVSAQLGIYYWNETPSHYGFNTWSADTWGVSPFTQFTDQTVEFALFKDGNPTTSGVKLFVNGSELSLSQTKGTSDSRTMGNGFRIGTGGQVDTQNYDGLLQEIIIYSSDQSANRTGIEGNINDYYNIY